MKYDDLSKDGYITHKHAQEDGADYTHPSTHICEYCNAEHVKKITKEVANELKQKAIA